MREEARFTFHSFVQGQGYDTAVCPVMNRNFSEKLLKCCFTSTETVDLLGTGAQDGHLDFHTAPELCTRAEHACMQVERREINSPLRFAGRIDDWRQIISSNTKYERSISSLFF